MSNIIVIQGTSYTITNIAEAKTALAAAQDSSEVLGVLDIVNNPSYVSDGAFTVSELTGKATSLSTTATGAEKILLYSGDLDTNTGGGLSTFNVVKEISETSIDSVTGIRKVATLDFTEAGLVTFNDEFLEALNNSIAEYPSSVPAGVDGYQIVTGKTSPTDSTPTSYNSGKGVADDISTNFIQNNDHLSVRALVATADDNGTFTKTEVRALLDSNTPDVEGI